MVSVPRHRGVLETEVLMEMKRAEVPAADVAALLGAAIEILSRGWTQRATARCSLGMRIAASHADAASWCATGALERGALKLWPTATSPVTNRDRFDAAACAVVMAALGEAPGDFKACGKLAYWNDTGGRTAEEVVAAFESALERIRGTAERTV